MMVPSLDEQSAVMVECVQNHTPSCMVIDEIGRPREVLAARTVKQRGVRIIASAHGDLRKLVKNKELRGLIGGVEQVVMGDAMAREEAKRRELTLQGDGMNVSVSTSKTKVQRASDDVGPFMNGASSPMSRGLSMRFSMDASTEQSYAHEIRKLVTCIWILFETRPQKTFNLSSNYTG
jgi:hypothetical protein